jgi:aminoglycoside phosphotransferase family enzyme/predicted kinase
MQLDRLIDALADPAAYPGETTRVEVHQTHISAVFLAGQHAYKIKKPVNFGFLDFSTLALRKHFCQEELRLNRRLATDVYLDLVPIVEADGGRVYVEAAGEPIEWAVKMRRLPDEATLEHRLARGESIDGALEALARRLAEFHSHAERSARISHFGGFEVVRRNALENFEQAAGQVGTAVSAAVMSRLAALTAQTLDKLRPTIEERAARGVPCDTHGDLRLGHVYWFGERRPPADLVIVDCIEFNERFRYADPVADMAFLAMGLARFGRADLADVFATAYFRESGDDEGRRLLPLYVSYRAAVRGKVDGLQALRPEIPVDERELALAKSRGHWLLALGTLEMPRNKPCLLLVSGLPGAGKSTLAVDLARATNCQVIRSDLVRKELAGVAAKTSQSAEYNKGIYAPQWNERVYAECLRRAEAILFEGGRVIVDASFREESQRRRFLEAAAHHGVPAVFFHCQADPAIVRQRLTSRTGDASDADWSIFEQAAQAWQSPTESTQRLTTTIDTGASNEAALAAALDVLRAKHLHE